MLLPPRPAPPTLPGRLPPILRVPPKPGPRFPLGPGGSRLGGFRQQAGMPPFVGQLMPTGPHMRDAVLPGGIQPMPPGFEGPLPHPSQVPTTLPQIRQQLAMMNMMQMLARLGKHMQKHTNDVLTPSAQYPGSAIPGN